MKKALDKILLKRIYNRTSSYYDLYHRLGTFNLDNKGRKFLVDRIVNDGDLILDAGGGTGTTTILALKKGGKNSKAVILDFSENMLKKAKDKAIENKLEKRISFKLGDMYDIPFPDNQKFIQVKNMTLNNQKLKDLNFSCDMNLEKGLQIMSI